MVSNQVNAAIRNYFKLATLFRASTAKEIQVLNFQGRRIYPQTRGVQEITDAIIFAGEWFVVNGDEVLSDGFVQTPYPPLSAYLVQLGPSSAIELLFEPPAELLCNKAFLLAGCPNYSHWLMDYLPRLEFYRGEIPLLVNHPMAPFQVESLEMLGIPADMVLGLDYPNAYRISNLVYPSTQSSVATPPLALRREAVDWLRKAFAPFFVSKEQHKKIFISRAGGAEKRDRRLINHEEIENVAKDQGFEIVACENLPFSEQVRLFSQASVIAGPHGAGFTNMVFAPDDARIIEFMGPGYDSDKRGGSTPFLKLAAITGQKFIRVLGRPDGVEPDRKHRVFEAYTIDAADFIRALKRCSCLGGCHVQRG